VNTAFGGTFASLLNTALRIDSGYTYGASSYFQPQKVAGPFTIASFTKNETTVPAIDLALKVLDDLHKTASRPRSSTLQRNTSRGNFRPGLRLRGSSQAESPQTSSTALTTTKSTSWKRGLMQSLSNPPNKSSKSISPEKTSCSF